MTNLLSATIVAEDCMSADAYATACMVMGEERTKLLLGDSKKIAVMLMSVNAEGKIVMWHNAAFGALMK